MHASGGCSMHDGIAVVAKLIKLGTSSCEAISGSLYPGLYGGLYGGSDDRETAENG
jgi:hypothetical protein